MCRECGASNREQEVSMPTGKMATRPCAKGCGKLLDPRGAAKHDRTCAGTSAGEQAVNELIPRLAAPKVEERLAPQNELQAMAAKASRPGAETERAELARILATEAGDNSVPQPARVWIVRQLEYIGAAESVPALTSLLNGQEAELRECARRALEKNSAVEAARSLREALAKGGDPAWRIGLITDSRGLSGASNARLCRLGSSILMLTRSA